MEILGKQDMTVPMLLLLSVGAMAIFGLLLIINSAKKDDRTSDKDKKGTIRLALGSIVFIIGTLIVVFIFLPEHYDAKVTDVSDVYDQGYEVVSVDKDTGVYTVRKRD